MTKNFELLTFEELLNLPIDIESCFDPIFEPPQELIDEWRVTYDAEPDEVPIFYAVEGDGPCTSITAIPALKFPNISAIRESPSGRCSKMRSAILLPTRRRKTDR